MMASGTETTLELRGLLHVFAERLVKDLTPSAIVHKFSVGLSASDKESIRSLEESESQIKAAELLLRKVVENKEAGTFAEFVNILHADEGCRHLADLLSGDDVDDLEPERRLLVALAPPLVKDINAVSLSEKITCLTDEDKDRIRNDNIRRGAQMAANTLLNRLPKRGPSWFGEFMAALETESPHLYCEILGSDAKGSVGDKEDKIKANASAMAIGADCKELRGLLEVFAERLVQELTPSAILHKFSVGLTNSDKESINSLEEREGEMKAAELLLRKIVESEEAGAFAEFVTVLRTTDGCKHLADLLSGQNVEDHEPQRRLLVALAPPLVKDINAISLLDKITCLTNEDGERIRNDYTLRSSRKAADTLLNRLPKRGPDWFRQFMRALKVDSLHLYQEILGIKTDDDGNVKDGEDETRAAKEFNAGMVAMGGTDVNLSDSDESSVGENKLRNETSEKGSLDSGETNNLTKPETGLVVDLNGHDEDRDNTMLKSVNDESTVGSPPMNINVHEQDSSGHDDDDDYDDYDDDDGKKEDKSKASSSVLDFQLRDYQSELAQPCLEGKNAIVCAPTGSGKTRIAAYITYHHLQSRSEGEGKVLLLVNKVPLVEQHYKKEFQLLESKYRISKICGETASKLSFMQLVENNDIVILTAQILENALNNGDGNDDRLSLTDFSLLIFDECHHTQKGEVYNNIMHQYLTEKLMNRTGGLPQIIGLTASLGVGDAKNKYKAVSHILKLCANMDASVLKTVQEERKELEKINNKPKKYVEVVGDRDFDPLGDELRKIMKDIQGMLPPAYQNRSDFGTQVYEQYITGLNDVAVKKEDRKMQTSAEHLRKYNDALLINDSVRMIDAVNYLVDFYDREELRCEGFDDTDESLLAKFNAHYRKLNQLSKKTECENPKLLKLKDQILEEFRGKNLARGIIFTQTRESAKALVAWMKDTLELKSVLRADRLTGTGSTSNSKSVCMTQKDQQEIIRKFQEGELNCIVATTVAEEGLDIPQCNIVIRYNLVTTMIAMVQSRGRARAEDSSYMLLAAKASGAANRELTNMYKEKLEKGAIDDIQKMKKEDFMEQVRAFQIKALNDRKLQEASVKVKKQQVTADMADLYCRKCSKVACNASEIRKIENMHHVNPSETFEKKFELREFSNPTEYGQITNMGIIRCKDCKKDWGTMILHKGACLPCLSVKNFGIKFKNGKKPVLTLKKWKDVPFEIEALDFTEYLEKQLNINVASLKETE